MKKLTAVVFSLFLLNRPLSLLAENKNLADMTLIAGDNSLVLSDTRIFIAYFGLVAIIILALVSVKKTSTRSNKIKSINKRSLV